MPISLKAVRQRAWHYLSPEIASAVGLTLAELQQFVAGSFTPDEKQLRDLAQRMRLR